MSWRYSHRRDYELHRQRKPIYIPAADTKRREYEFENALTQRGTVARVAFLLVHPEQALFANVGKVTHVEIRT